MQDDCIAVALELPQLWVVWQRELEEHFEVGVMYRGDEVNCPRCGKVTNKGHDRKLQVQEVSGA